MGSVLAITFFLPFHPTSSSRFLLLPCPSRQRFYVMGTFLGVADAQYSGDLERNVCSFGLNFVFLSLNLDISAPTCLIQILTMFVFLIRMINDPKSAQFITWTELGTSFVVSNVGEFSRSILGSHFKHNNVRFTPMDYVSWLTGLSLFQFSSFVRQLNMYGFHKINRVKKLRSI